MTTICSWCEAAGAITLLGDDGVADGRTSHGICDVHARSFERELDDTLDAGLPA